jgi:peptide/nickel transport system substrate-binding protein
LQRQAKGLLHKAAVLRLLVLAFLSSPLLAQWGGELRFCLRSEPRSFDPANVDDEASEVIRYLTGGVLVRVNRLTQEPEPSLAVSWKILDGGRTIRFQLREGVRFSDGTPFTADDVVFTMLRLLNPATHSPDAEQFRAGNGVVRTSADGPCTVTIKFPAVLAGGVKLFDPVAILSRRSQTASLGPFHLSEHKPGAYIRLERNPNYWRTHSGRKLPYLDSIRLDIQQNRDAELLRFRRGEVHLISRLGPDQFEELARDRPGEAKDAGITLENEFLWFNMSPAAPLPSYRKAWFNSRDFRLAISHAIHRDDLCRVVYHGHAAAARGPFPPSNLFWFNPGLQPHSADPGLARRLLLSVGFRYQGDKLLDRDGHAVEFSVVTSAGNQSRERMATLIQQDLAAIGIRFNIVTLDFPSLLERIGKSLAYESCLLGFNNIDLDPDGQMNLWLSSSAQHAWNPLQPSPATPWEAEIDRLMREQASAPTASRRKTLFDRVQQIVSDQAPLLYLVNPSALVAVSSRLRGVRPSVMNPRVVWNIDELYLAAQAAGMAAAGMAAAGK